MRQSGAVLFAGAASFVVAVGGSEVQAAIGSDAKYITPEVRQILALPEDKIDTGVAALTIAKEVYPKINVAAYSAQIDQLAMDAKRYIDWYGRHDPDSIIRALNTWYYRAYGVQYDKSPGNRESQDNYYLNRIVDTRKGMCITIPLLYMVIAQRLGYPVRAVFVPEHSFVRYVDPSLKEQNIELSAGAGYSSDEDYAYRLNINERGIASGAFLRTLTKRQYLASLLMQNALVFIKRGDVDRADWYLERAHKLDPKDIVVVKNLSTAYRMQSKRTQDPVVAASLKAKSIEYFWKTEDMGWTRDPDANIRREKR